VLSNGGADCATVTGIIDAWAERCITDGSQCSIHAYTCQRDPADGTITTCTNASGTKAIQFKRG
jgi:hypothetical protein